MRGNALVATALAAGTANAGVHKVWRNVVFVIEAVLIHMR